MVLSGINVCICAHILYCMNLKYEVTVLPAEIPSSPDSINPYREDICVCVWACSYGGVCIFMMGLSVCSSGLAVGFFQVNLFLRHPCLQ